jgi:Kef-type K+ transport system membrane component KefB
MPQIVFALFVMLISSWALGRLAAWIRQPPIMGEILAGILIGPTIAGRLFPSIENWLYAPSGPTLQFLGPFNTLGGIFLMLVAGLEIGRANVVGERKTVLLLSTMGMLIPFALGLMIASIWRGLLPTGAVSPWAFRLFYATALAISALPVITKTLMDLNLLATRVGQLTVTAASVIDVFGWIVFSALLGVVKVHGLRLGEAASSIGLSLGFALFMLKAAPPGLAWLIHRLQPSLSTIFSIVALSSLAAAILADWIGIHFFFGAFFAGIAWGRVKTIAPSMAVKAKGFVIAIFAPLFFASMALNIDLLANFNAILVVTTLLIACIGKIGGCRLAGWLAGMDVREAWAVGICLNARGAMEIVLGLVAYQEGMISAPLFVALIVTALATSALVGPIVPAILSQRSSSVPHYNLHRSLRRTNATETRRAALLQRLMFASSSRKARHQRQR